MQSTVFVQNQTLPGYSLQVLVLMQPVDCNSIDVSSVALIKTCKTDTVTHAGDGGSSL